MVLTWRRPVENFEEKLPFKSSFAQKTGEGEEETQDWPSLSRFGARDGERPLSFEDSVVTISTVELMLMFVCGVCYSLNGLTATEIWGSVVAVSRTCSIFEDLLLFFMLILQVTLADFSFAFRYSPGGKHVPQRECSRTPHEGTLEFISLDSHKGAGETLLQTQV